MNENHVVAIRPLSLMLRTIKSSWIYQIVWWCTCYMPRLTHNLASRGNKVWELRVVFCLAGYDNYLSLVWVTGEPGAGWECTEQFTGTSSPFPVSLGNWTAMVYVAAREETQTPSLVIIDIGRYYALAGFCDMLIW